MNGSLGVLIMQDTDIETLLARARRAEELGFDQVFFADHSGDFRDLTGTWFDGWSLLAATARETSRIRIGTMVANPILRTPTVMAKEAVAIDHLSAGRLDLGLGAGIFEMDHHAVGEEAWSVRERVQRFGEYVEILDGVLRSTGKPYEFEGTWLRTSVRSTAPGPVQRPRPPLIVGGHAPTVLRVAAEHAEVWNTNGRYGKVGMDASLDEVMAYVRDLNRQVDEACERVGRDPATLRRSMLFDPLNLDRAPDGPEASFAAAADAGVQDFVLTWPEDGQPEQLDQFEQLAADRAAGALPRG